MEDLFSFAFLSAICLKLRTYPRRKEILDKITTGEARQMELWLRCVCSGSINIVTCFSSFFLFFPFRHAKLCRIFHQEQMKQGARQKGGSFFPPGCYSRSPSRQKKIRQKRVCSIVTSIEGMHLSSRTDLIGCVEITLAWL